MSAQERWIGIALLFVLAGLLAFLGLFKGWTINGLPAHYIGVFVTGWAIAGACGANIFFEKREEPPSR